MAAVARPQPNILAAPPLTPPSPRKTRTVRDTFLNMLGEFVALSKTPDFKLSPKSNQFIAEAIRDEVRAERQRLLNEALFQKSHAPRHTRTISMSSYTRRNKAAPTVSLDPTGGTVGQATTTTTKRSVVDRRQSLPVIGDAAASPVTFFQRVRRLSQRQSRAAEAETSKIAVEPTESNVEAQKQTERRHKSRSRRDASKSRKESGDETNVREHRYCRHHSASGTRRHCRSSAPTVEVTVETVPATESEATERRRTARVRKHKISAAAMIADVAEETETPVDSDTVQK